MFYSQKALEQAQFTGEELEIGTIYMNIGFAHISEDPTKAETYTRRAEKIFREFSNLKGLANVQENLGIISLKRQQWLEANWHLENALESWRTLANKPGEIRTMLYLVELELARSDHEQALSWLTEAESLLILHDQAKLYYQLQQRIEYFRRSLTMNPVCLS